MKAALLPPPQGSGQPHRRLSVNEVDPEGSSGERAAEAAASADDTVEPGCCARCRADARRRGFVLVRAVVAIVAYMCIALLAFAPWWGTSLWNDEAAEENIPWYLNAVYFAVTTLTTVGYGDISPATDGAKMFVAAYSFLGIGYILYAVVQAGDYLLAKQEERLRAVVAKEQKGLKEHSSSTVLCMTMARVMSIIYALCLIVGSLAIGTIFFAGSSSDKNVLDALWLACMTSTTIGYGDEHPNTVEERAFAVGYILASTLMVAYALSLIAEVSLDAKGEEREHNMRIMMRAVTNEDLAKADVDGDGQISEEEFVVYKLLEMNKVTTEEVLKLREVFKQFDRDGSGSIDSDDLRILPSDLKR